MSLNFLLYKYLPIFRFKKRENCTLFCNVANDLDFHLPFSVGINTSKAFNVCTVVQFNNLYKKLLFVLCLRNYKIDSKLFFLQ
jgi:hypothetical protein